ncbi:hypothetical protein GF325_11845 [Candidatus Bathyarchaeota archaeon]|nr:hypothetical protein [Candidatus Bathyarchaeota archaeon]
MNSKRKITGGIAAGCAAAFIIGFLVSPGGILAGGTPKPSPTIDGSWNNGENWNGANWVFIEYIITDPDHVAAHNYFYVHLDGNTLYILADLVSDITNDTGQGEWFSVWIDCDNSTNIYTDAEWNTFADSEGADMLVFDYDLGVLNDTLEIEIWGAPPAETFIATLNDSVVSIASGFQSTRNGQQPHRIYEISIDTTHLYLFNQSAFNVGFLGYGTLASLVGGGFSEFWGAPTYFYYEYQWFNYIYEFTYFKCA